MGNQNGYFQLIRDDKGMNIKLFKAEEGGENITLDEIVKYLEKNQILGIDIKSLNKAVEMAAQKEQVVTLTLNKGYPVDELMIVQVIDDNMKAVARFYPPSNDGNKISKKELLSDLENAGIKFGIKDDELDRFLKERQYCTDYVIAEGVLPRQGKNAEITYMFNTDRKAKPKRNEDGSVDFHNLDNISHIKKGDVLAKLTPADLGDIGTDIYDNKVYPYKVERKKLKHGKNIHLSEDELVMISDVDGHVTLEGEKVFVSNVYEVPADVDVSTGDITYEGSVVVKGNVRTGFKIKSGGNVEVFGAVEGAEIVSGGQIILRHGMQGMAKGVLVAKGNIIAKFIESAKVYTQGYVEAASIIQSQVSASGAVNVMGAKGNIIGGHVRSASSISAKTIGSPMGISTTVEVGVDPVLKDQMEKLKNDLEEANAKYKKLDQIVTMLKKKMELGQLDKDKVPVMKKSIEDMNLLKKEMMDYSDKIEEISEQMLGNSNAFISVTQAIYPGTKIIVGEDMKFINEELSHCKFKKKDGDIKSNPL